MNKRFHRFLTLFLLLLALCPLLLTPAWADTGPKPSVTVTVNGLEDSSYTVTLLSEQSTTGPWRKTDRFEESYANQDADEGIWTALNDYADPDGFYFIGCYQLLGGGSNIFRWNYYPPETFKLLIYLPETGEFITDDVAYQRYAFHSSFTATVEGGEVSSISQNWSALLELPGLLFRMAVTLAVELLLALCFGFRSSRSLLIIAAVNLVTQLILNLALNLLYFFWDFSLLLAIAMPLLELAVALVEGGLYRHFLTPKESRRTHPMGYSFAANACSFVLGLALSLKFPNLF